MVAVLSKPLIVPEYLTGLIRAYVPQPVAGAVARAAYTIDLQAVLDLVIPPSDPGRRLIARPNTCALSGEDLFVTNSSPTSQCVFKFPGYLSDPARAIAEAFVFTLDGSDYIGMTIDPGTRALYVAEGSGSGNAIVRFTGIDLGYPGAQRAGGNNYATRTVVGTAGQDAPLFSNLVIDGVGNLWASDYRNDRVVAFDGPTLTTDAPAFRTLANLSGPVPVATTTAALAAPAAQLFSSPEGVDFDAEGNLWIANNNDRHATARTSLVKITPALQQELLALPSGGTLTPSVAQSNVSFAIYQVPNTVDDSGGLPQFGGLQIDQEGGRLIVNEQVAGNARLYTLAEIAALDTKTSANDLPVVSTNPGNGGIALVVSGAVP